MSIQLPQIMCHQCQKPVSNLSYQVFPERDEYIFIVRCHGQFERTTMPARMFCEGWQITQALAFQKPPEDVTLKGYANDNQRPPQRSDQVLDLRSTQTLPPLKQLTYKDDEVSIEDRVKLVKDMI